MTSARPIEYAQDDKLNLFVRPGFRGIGYSDGDSAEEYLYQTVCDAVDRSSLSAELARAVVDWPSEYHLSRERHSLIRPLGIQPGETVLELGAGCGAITRFLGEIGAEITAVEGTLERGRVAAERCRDLANVRVIVDDLARFESDQRFQWILLVGVLEYASVFLDHPHAARQYLKYAARFLAEDGKLVVAIENKLGLKYFNGCSEDHIGVPFLGVQGLYGDRTPRTFGRRELDQQLNAAGLQHLQHFYPFPDYKLPQVILSERALADELFEPANLLAMCVPRDYTRQTMRLFDDALVMREVIENGLLADLSNSLMVVASRTPFTLNNQDLAVTFTAYRAREFATQTRFLRSPQGIEVVKEALDATVAREATLKDGSTLTNVLEASEYFSGPLQYWRLIAARAREGEIDEIIAALEPWFEFLLRQVVLSTSPSNGSPKVPGRYLDLTPYNLIEGTDGIVPIDQEWCIDRDIPLAWVVTRCVLNTLCGRPGFENSAIAMRRLIEDLYGRHGLEVTTAEIEEALDREVELCSLVVGLDQERVQNDVKSHATLPLHRAAVERGAKIDEQARRIESQAQQIESQALQIDALARHIEPLAAQLETLQKDWRKLERATRYQLNLPGLRLSVGRTKNK
jgi:SAM-dependent methyltransferase